MKDTKIFFESGYLLDSNYERAVANQSKIASMAPVFQEAWDRVGAAFLQATQSEIKVSFRRTELTASLIMHPEVFSCSHPFLININRFMDFDVSSEDQVIEFCELVYHEALHILLDDNFPDLTDRRAIRLSKLISELPDEDDVVVSHLHLYAIQQKVLKSRGWPGVWEKIVADSSDLHHPGYHRAINIVQQTGAEKFIAELE